MQSTFRNVTGLAQMQGQWLRRRHFNAEVLAHVAERIRTSEVGHTGELVLAIEAIMPSHESDSHQRALEVYGRLRVWDTPQNSGVLLYLALDQRRIEIVADRAITATPEQWSRVCVTLQQAFVRKEYVEGLMAAVDDIEVILKAHAPASEEGAASDVDYLPNEPVFL
ncbi:TPM domain-containing protein [Paenalcaligenes niemegkensis]|uniref:TPM domain-containing protein n=1 Tax=Paenalcaligenes niemegkensis TaxID=2895469 RepID=UPI001EE78A79|nr:TPM domain-containing protein [Paenalcaligenes niemegkensis]MCQ9618035.1 TPM domain-containing protein [Paenalcaligenes niemegkensis]